MSSSIARFVTPFKYRRDQEEAARIRLLRQRDGDECRRCRRPMRFDLPAGHDQGAWVQPVLYEVGTNETSFDNLCLTHRRCNAASADHTAEVTDRIRRKQEAELFSKSRKRA
jgi:hypothetical protein